MDGFDLNSNMFVASIHLVASPAEVYGGQPPPDAQGQAWRLSTKLAEGMVVKVRSQLNY